MDLTILYLCIISFIQISTSYGKTLGRHFQACRPMTGLVRAKFPNCRESKVLLDQCIGTCISWDGLPENADSVVSTCTCCKPVTFEEKRVFVECMDELGRSQIEEHTIQEPKACSCVPCNRRRKRSEVLKKLLSGGDKGLRST